MGGFLRAVAAAFIGAAVFPHATGRAAVILDSLAVRVYDSAGVLARDRARAMDRARQILAHANVDVQWRDCTRGGCAVAPTPGELVVRLVRSPRKDSHGRVLGAALIDSATGEGTLATVFVDRITAVASPDPWPAVGAVMAHELGHLLLGTNSHSDSGLMREIWSARDLSRGRIQDWLFSSAQRNHLQSSRLPLRSRPRS